MFTAWLEAFHRRLEAPDDFGAPDGTWLTWVQRHCIELWLSAAQVAQLLGALEEAGLDELSRVKCFVATWARLVDEENAHEAINLVSAQGRVELSERLGYLNLFNPLQPNGRYILDLTQAEQHTLAHVLVTYANEEPGENIEDCQYTFGGDELRPCVIPRTWVANLPTKGLLSLVYHAEPGTEKMEMRQETACKLLGWE